jgi:hypothetical protein
MRVLAVTLTLCVAVGALRSCVVHQPNERVQCQLPELMERTAMCAKVSTHGARDGTSAFKFTRRISCCLAQVVLADAHQLPPSTATLFSIGDALPAACRCSHSVLVSATGQLMVNSVRGCRPMSSTLDTGTSALVKNASTVALCSSRSGYNELFVDEVSVLRWEDDETWSGRADIVEVRGFARPCCRAACVNTLCVSPCACTGRCP